MEAVADAMAAVVLEGHSPDDVAQALVHPLARDFEEAAFSSTPTFPFGRTETMTDLQAAVARAAARVCRMPSS